MRMPKIGGTIEWFQSVHLVSPSTPWEQLGSVYGYLLENRNHAKSSRNTKQFDLDETDVLDLRILMKALVS